MMSEPVSPCMVSPWPIAARRAVIAAMAAAAFAAGFISAATAQDRQQDKPPAKVTLSLDFIPLGRHAPWYAALAEGYFKEEGLDVSIIPSQGTAQTIQAVEAGTANIAFVDVPSVILARANGSRLKMIAVNYQKAPYAIFSLAGVGNVTQARELEGLKLGSGAGSFTPKVIEGFMAQQGLDPGKLKIVNIAPPARASALLSGQVPAIEFFVMARPGLENGARDAHAELRTFLLSDHGFALYSNGLAVGEDYLASNGEVVKAFVRAALKGWKLALADPQRAAQDQLKYVASLKPDMIVAELGIVGDLAVTPDVKQNGLGWFDPIGMKSALDFVTKFVGMTGTPPAATDIYALGFLPTPAIKP